MFGYGWEGFLLPSMNHFYRHSLVIVEIGVGDVVPELTHWIGDVERLRSV